MREPSGGGMATAGEAVQEECSVCVAVKIRPLVAAEVDVGCAMSMSVTPKVPQITTGEHSFTFDHVYGDLPAEEPSWLFQQCISPLVDGLFRGYNATVLAYGQTGSGKTYTMGSEYRPGGHPDGVIPDVIAGIFERMAAARDVTVTIRVSFVEIHNEKIKDLLRPAVPGEARRPAISIRELHGKGGGVFLEGAVEQTVTTRDETARVLELGTLCRTTAATFMNKSSSRSHAIFTLTVEQRRIHVAGGTTSGGAPEEEGGDDFLCAKMHLVDLAGSERAKRTKAEGKRLKEGIKINESLFALGNVINAIVEQRFVPYRDSKLTRLLQDSLGGNSRTVMIACVSPADINYAESVNTLKYAQHARNIKNKPVVNRDPMAAQVAALRAQLAAERAKNAALTRALAGTGRSIGGDAGHLLLDDPGGEHPEGGGGGGGGHWALAEGLRGEMGDLQMTNSRLQLDLRGLQEELDETVRLWQHSQAQLVTLRRSCAGAPPGSDEQRAAMVQAQEGGDVETVRGYLSRITELEREIKNLRAFQRLTSMPARAPGAALGPSPRRVTAAAAVGASPDPHSPYSSLSNPRGEANGLSPSYSDGGCGDGGAAGLSTDIDEQWFLDEMATHALEQDKMKSDMAQLQAMLDGKERKMQELVRSTGQVPALKQHYDRVLAEVAAERDALVAERKALVAKLSDLATRTEEEHRRMEAQYRERLAAADERLKELKFKERDYAAVQKLKQRTEDACKRLNADIVKIKQQKVGLQKAMDASHRQFTVWRTERERELLQLRRQNRMAAATIQHLESLRLKQNAVLQRKIADANAARKKLRDLQAASSRTKHSSAAANGAATGGGAAGDAGAQRVPGAGLLAGNGGGSGDPCTTAPLLRTENARRAWVTKELDMCSTSFEYKRILDAEVAQRSEAAAQLKAVEKKLILLGDSKFQLKSPLTATATNGVVAATPVGRAAGHLYKLEPKEQLLTRSNDLQEQINRRNKAICDLQIQIERAKSEEEVKGGGAADPRRWAGVRTVVEAREMLKTLFKTASDIRTAGADADQDVKKLLDEKDLLDVKLEGCRRELDSLKECLALGQGYAQAPPSMSAGPSRGTLRARGANHDAKVDVLVKDLKARAGNTPSGAAPSAVPASSSALGGVTSPDGSVHVAIATPHTLPDALPLTPVDAAGSSLAEDRPWDGAEPGVGKTLHFEGDPTPLSASEEDVTAGRVRLSAGSMRRVDRYSPYSAGEDGDHVTLLSSASGSGSEDDAEEEDDEEDATSHGSGYTSASVADEDDDDDAGGGDSSEGDVDYEWRPDLATPARQRGGQNRPIPSHVPPQRAPSITNLQPPAPTTALPSSAPQPLQRSGSAPAPVVVSGPSATSSGGAATVPADVEAAALAAVNRRRTGGGQPLEVRFTKDSLKAELKGKVVNGKLWAAGKKTRDQLLRDLCHDLGLMKLDGAAQGSPPAMEQDGRGAGDSGPSTPEVLASAAAAPALVQVQVQGQALQPGGRAAAEPQGPASSNAVGPAASRPYRASPVGGLLRTHSGNATLTSPGRHSPYSSSPRAAAASKKRWQSPGPSPSRGAFAAPSPSSSRPSLLMSPSLPRDYRAAVLEPLSPSASPSASMAGLPSPSPRAAPSSATPPFGSSGRARSSRAASPSVRPLSRSYPTFSAERTAQQQQQQQHPSSPASGGAVSHAPHGRAGTGGGGSVAAAASRYDVSLASRRGAAMCLVTGSGGSLTSRHGGAGDGGTPQPLAGGLVSPRTGLSGGSSGRGGWGGAMRLPSEPLSEVGALRRHSPGRDAGAMTPQTLYWHEKTQATQQRTHQMDVCSDQQDMLPAAPRNSALRLSQPNPVTSDINGVKSKDPLRDSLSRGGSKSAWK